MSPAEKISTPRKVDCRRGRKSKIKYLNRKYLFDITEIKSLMKELSLSCNKVNNACGLSAGTINNVIRGYGVSLVVAFKVANFFGKSIEELWKPLVKEEIK